MPEQVGLGLGDSGSCVANRVPSREAVHAHSNAILHPSVNGGGRDVGRVIEGPASQLPAGRAASGLQVPARLKKGLDSEII
jgi:hypothetical protein